MRTFIMLTIVMAGSWASAQKTAQKSAHNDCNPKMLPVLWQQTAAEYRALCYQAFNLATLRINEIPKKELKKGNLAIVTDVDETIVDNSFGEAQLILDHESHSSATWKEWTNLHAAPALPGAVEFLKATYAKGISIFYISNRETDEIASTIENLKALSLPCADTAHMLFMTNTSSKESRRQKVMEHYKIVMLLGDNLNDFASFFEKRSISERLNETDKIREDWGDNFIVLPNSTYGEWENALYGYRKGLTTAQKDSVMVTLLKGYKSK
jgi:5'-nucleotidase (lipoprotein e(P4) family)